MKFATFSTKEIPGPHLGIVSGNEILDVDLAGRALKLTPPDQMLALIANYERARQDIQAILDKANGRRFSEVKTFTDVGAAHALDEVQLHAPIPQPRKNVMCMALNYSEHAKETAEIRGRQANDLPTIPILFTKATTAVTGPYDSIEFDPEVSKEIDWEVELGVIIGKAGKNIREQDAMAHVFGYTVLNDITARDLQSRHKQYFKGKSLDSSCPMGPWIVTADEIADPQQLGLRLRVNGETKQDSNTRFMIFSIPTIITTLALGMTLEPGDIIATGTPDGVGFSRKPPEFLKPGDVVEAEVDGIGAIRNRVVEVQR